MPYIYFFTDDEYSEKNSMIFDKQHFNKNELKIASETDDSPSDSELENLKKDANDKKFMILIQISQDCIEDNNGQAKLNQDKLTDINISLTIHRVIPIEKKAVTSKKTPKKPLPPVPVSSIEDLIIPNSSDPLLNPSESSSSNSNIPHKENPQIKVSTQIETAIEAIEDYLTLHKKIDIAAAKKAFYKKFPNVTKKINNSDNEAADAASSSEPAKSEIKMDKGVTRAIAHLLLLQSEHLETNFKLLCLSSLLNTTNSTLLRQFVASTLANKTNTAVYPEETNLNTKSIIIVQKNNVDTAIEKLGKEKNADFSRAMDTTDELTNAVELLYKGNETELANSIPSSNNPISSSNSLSQKKEKEADSSQFQFIAKTAIEKYLIHVKHIEPKTAYQNFKENKNPKSTLFFFTSRDGINRALCYLNAINKSEISEPEILVVLGALLKTQKSMELRFYLASAILKFTANPLEKISIDNVDAVINSAFITIKHAYLSQSENNSTLASKAVENNGFDVSTKSLSERIESNYQLNISVWFAEQTAKSNLVISL